MTFATTQMGKYHDITYMWNLEKKDTNDLICKTETDSENKFMVTKDEMQGRRSKLGAWD